MTGSANDRIFIQEALAHSVDKEALRIVADTSQKKKTLHYLLDAVRKDEGSIHFGFVTSLLGSNEDAEIASSLLPVLMDHVRMEAFPDLEEKVRLNQGYPGLRRWKPEELKLLPGYEASVAVQGFMSFHADGYLREAAVEKLALCHTGEELPYLLLRVNDWVPVVASRAIRAIQARYRREYIPHLLHWLPLMLRLGEMRRFALSRVLASTTILLREPTERPTVRATLNATSSSACRLLLYKVLIECETGDALLSLIRRALSGPDGSVRLWAVRWLRASKNTELYRELLPDVMQAALPAQRLEALYGVMEMLPERAPSLLKEALLDSNGTVRETARYYLNKLSVLSLEEVVAYYRQTVETMAAKSLTRKQQIAAIAGIQEVGSVEDARLLLPFLSSPLPSIRSAAVRAISRLSGDASAPMLLEALRSESPRVSREAREALLLRLHLAPKDDLRQLVKESRFPHIRRNALMILVGGERWSALPVLIRAHQDEDPTVREIAVRLLPDLRDYIYTAFSPSTKQLEDLDRTLVELETLPDKLRQGLLEVLEYWKKRKRLVG